MTMLLLGIWCAIYIGVSGYPFTRKILPNDFKNITWAYITFAVYTILCLINWYIGVFLFPILVIICAIAKFCEEAVTVSLASFLAILVAGLIKLS